MTNPDSAPLFVLQLLALMSLLAISNAVSNTSAAERSVPARKSFPKGTELPPDSPAKPNVISQRELTDRELTEFRKSLLDLTVIARSTHLPAILIKVRNEPELRGALEGPESSKRLNQIYQTRIPLKTFPGISALHVALGDPGNSSTLRTTRFVALMNRLDAPLLLPSPTWIQQYRDKSPILTAQLKRDEYLAVIQDELELSADELDWKREVRDFFVIRNGVLEVEFYKAATLATLRELWVFSANGTVEYRKAITNGTGARKVRARSESALDE